VRQLAVRLCRDESDADDLVQDVWLEALRGGSPRSPRPWLGGIVRHLWRRRHAPRNEFGEANPRDPMPSPDALLARAELQRRVLAEVAKLDEAYRTVVLMRHFEGISSEEIARRLGVPASTVRNRLARAHERLRARLDRDYGGSRGAWVVLFAPAFPGMPASSVAAGIGVTMKIQLTVGAALLAAAAMWWWPSGSEGISVETSTASTDSALARPLELAGISESPGETGEGARRSIAEGTAPVEDVLVWGELLGALEDRALEGELQFAADFEEPRRASIGKGPSYSHFGLAPGKYRISSSFRGYRPIEEEIELASDAARVRRDLSLVPSLMIPVRFVEAGTGATLQVRPFGWNSGLGVVATRAPPQRLRGVVEHAPTHYGIGTFHESFFSSNREFTPQGTCGVLEVRADPPIFASAVFRTEILETRSIRGDERELVFEIDRALVESLAGSLTLTCVDADTGDPVVASVAAEPNDVGGGGVATAADGTVRLDGLLPGMLVLSVHAQGYAGIRRWIRVEAAELLELGVVAVSRGASIQGRVVGPDGHGERANLNVIPLRRDRAPRDADSRGGRTSAQDGSFSLSSLERGRARLVAESDGFAIAAIEFDTSSGDLRDLELRLDPGVPVELRCARGALNPIDALLVDAQGLPLRFSRLYRTLGTTLRLLPGAYEIQIVIDQDVVARRPFVVGESPQVIELELPE
jgi:RNA polymerase sigma factor (sigma-70 family)